MSVGSPSVWPMSTKTARVRSSYRCSECGWETAKWVGRCGECQAWGSVAEARRAGPARRRRSGLDAGRAHRAGRDHGVGRAPQRRARARPRPRRRARAGCRDPAGRRAGRRQEHAAAGGGRPDREHPPAHPLRHRRGVGRPGAAARRPHRRRARRAVPRRGDRPRGGAHPHRGRTPHAAGRRLDPDDRRLGHRRRPRGRHPGQGGRRRAHPRREDPQHHHDDRRPRHQGRVDRRPARARAPRRRRAPLRGRPQLPLPHGPCHEEPLRPRRRGGLLRPLLRGHLRRHRPDRALRRAPHARTSPAPASP